MCTLNHLPEYIVNTGLDEKQEKEKEICSNFFRDALEDSGGGTEHRFAFLGCSPSNLDPPDCWAEYKEIKRVGFELAELNIEEARRQLARCNSIADLLNKKGAPPIKIGPITYSDTVSKHFSVSDASTLILKFLNNNLEILDDTHALMQSFLKYNRELASQVGLCKPDPNSTKVSLMGGIIASSTEQLFSIFETKFKEKLEKIKQERGLWKNAERKILLFHFNSTLHGGTFAEFDFEILFARFRQKIRELDPERKIFRTYLYCPQGFSFYGHRVRFVALRQND